MAKEKKGSLSGISIGLAFAALGFVYSFWLTDVYGSVTRYVAAILILFGAVGLLIELQKFIKDSGLRFDNGGVGLLLLVPAGFGAYFVNLKTSGVVRGLAVAAISAIALFGLAGFIDLFVSVIESFQTKENLSAKLTNLFKLLALLLSSVATIIAAIRQIT